MVSLHHLHINHYKNWLISKTTLPKAEPLSFTRVRTSITNHDHLPPPWNPPTTVGRSCALRSLAESCCERLTPSPCSCCRCQRTGSCKRSNFLSCAASTGSCGGFRGRGSVSLGFLLRSWAVPWFLLRMVTMVGLFHGSFIVVCDE